jgi:hypothetical protein
VGHASRSSDLLCVEGSLGRVSQSGPKNWRMRDNGWCTWHHHGGYVGGKLKTDGSM